ncbi:multicopper oxidase domain-containing protein [Candidatus Peregrinibacteria bacterium]|nr:multicopper oxidase domain-containing protein [bacterium]NCQ55800.1 multicopper oxidase domain-containing protein [Candidatus Parcubacteria bacterium]NCS67867.1 multicopper oxidase domain-containing protein [Candidatus Peregrinibacteria bacterium]
MKTFVMTLTLAFLLTACADTTSETNSALPNDNSSMASGTQLAGTPMQTETDNGDTLVGGDAVAPDETPGEVSFTVLGSNFAFDMEEIRVKEGDEVTINFRSTDGFHDWVVDEFDAATEQVQTDGETSVTFIADKAGTYEYYCSVGNHRANGMVGTLIVE